MDTFRKLFDWKELIKPRQMLWSKYVRYQNPWEGDVGLLGTCTSSRKSSREIARVSARRLVSAQHHTIFWNWGPELHILAPRVWRTGESKALDKLLVGYGYFGTLFVRHQLSLPNFKALTPKTNLLPLLSLQNNLAEFTRVLPLASNTQIITQQNHIN